MKEIVQWIKKISLFLSGVVLVIWGYKVNASNNVKDKLPEKVDKEPQTSSMFSTIELKNSTASKQSEENNEEVKSEDVKEEKSDKATNKSEEKAAKIPVKEKAQKTETSVDSNKTDKSETVAQPKSENPLEVKTVIESDKEVEESSGTE